MDSSVGVIKAENMESLIRHFESCTISENERLQVLRERVFSLEEILEVILEYFPGRDSLSDCLKLRTVNKLWRKCVFKLLINHFTTYRKLHVDSARVRHFRRKIPNTAYIPLCVKFDVYTSTQYLHNWNGLLDYTSSIVEFHLCDWRLGKTDFAIDNLSSFQLPSLRKLNVKVNSPNELNHERGTYSGKVINQLVKSTKQLHEFFLTIELDKDAGHNNTPCYVPRQVTHLTISDSCSNSMALQSFLGSEIDNLKSFSFATYLLHQIVTPSVLNNLLERVCGTTGELKLNNNYSRDSKFTTGVDLTASLKKVKSLTVINIGYEFFVENMAEILPHITDLSISGFEQQVFLDNINLVPSNFDCLTALTLECSFVTYIVDENPFRSMFMRMRNIKSLKLTCLTSTLATNVLKHIFTYLGHVSKLEIEIDETSEMLCQVDEDNLDYLLTGIKTHDIPDCKNAWCEIIESSLNSIINLKDLEELTLDVTEVKQSMVSPFVMATLLKLRKLLKLNVTGNEYIEEGLVATWKSEGRQITNTIIEDLSVSPSDSYGYIPELDSAPETDSLDSQASYDSEIHKFYMIQKFRNFI